MPSEAPLYVTCLAAIVFMAIGWGIGFADSNRNSAKKIQAAEMKAEIAVKEAQDKIADASTRLQMISENVTDDPGLLRLRMINGVLNLELDGLAVASPNLTADERKRLIELLTLMRPWLEGQTAQQPAPRPAAAVPSMQPRPAPPPVATTPPSTPVAPVVTEPLTEPKAPAALSIVEQIDSILQAHLVNTPLARHGIRLQQSREGGVEVVVGVNKYGTVDDVPDPQIKSVIRAAITEWEEKFTPGV